MQIWHTLVTATAAAAAAAAANSIETQDSSSVPTDVKKWDGQHDASTSATTIRAQAMPTLKPMIRRLRRGQWHVQHLSPVTWAACRGRPDSLKDVVLASTFIPSATTTRAHAVPTFRHLMPMIRRMGSGMCMGMGSDF